MPSKTVTVRSAGNTTIVKIQSNDKKPKPKTTTQTYTATYSNGTKVKTIVTKRK